ncbi:MAG: hypothetical protein MJ236_06980, partial [Clostridia bacterium]|nr:hypothetical protein [Clostridia bacterium]
IAYTDDFDVTFQKEYGYSIMDRLPEVVFESSDGKLSQARYAFHNHRTDRFVEAFSDTIGEWCDKNNLNMTGHFFREPSLHGQTTAVGDVMRSYRAFSIPGIDILSDKHEISCVKQCQSSVRQYGREGMTSELYGVTTWEFDFRGHKQQGDWQAAMGVTVRVPHLFWMSMKGDAKRDYPASIGYQSPWYKEYKYIEDHFARVNTAMTRGKPVVRIGVIHPIESYWLYYGPYSQTSHARRELANRYYELINWFVFGSLDFDMICEANLQSQYVESSNGFTVGCEKYDMIVVPGLTTIRSATLDLLEKFVARGGKVVFMGDVPAYVDANESSKALELAQKSISIDWSRRKLFDLAEEYRDIKILDGSCEYASNLTYNMRDDNGIRRVFIAHVVEPKRYEYDSTDLEKYTIQLKGEWKVTLLNTLDGNKYEVAAKYVNGETIVTWVCGCCDSLLIELEPGKRTEGIELKVPSYSWSGCIEDSAEYSLEEQNVMLLDMPRFSFDNGELNESEEILRVSDKAKIHFDSLTLKGWQPWMKPRSKEPKGVVKLVYEFESEIDCSNVQLALENIEYSQVTFNGIKSDMVDRGYYVDEDAIRVINVSNVKKGTNLLEIEIKYNDTVCIESCYLLGNFGVNIIGGKAKVVELPKKLVFDNVVNQGLAFYSGNITYHLKYTGAGNKAIGIHRFKGAAISVDVDGERVQGMVSFPPNVLNLGLLKDGEHNIDVTVYGNRWNTFGPLHDSYVKPSFPSPEVYKRPNRWFVREYQVHPFGILTTPVIMDK